MYTASFFRTRLGLASLLSIVGMLGMNVVALNAQKAAVPAAYASAPIEVELA